MLQPSYPPDADEPSLSEAEQATSLFARVDYAFKRFLWL